MGGPGFNPQYHKEKAEGLAGFSQHGVRPPATCWQAKQPKQEVGQVPSKEPAH